VPAGSEVTVLRFENEDVDILHYMKQRGVEPEERYAILRREGLGDAAETVLRDVAGGEHAIGDRLARTVSVRVDERGDGDPSALTAGTPAEMQLLGQSAWGM
jgi:hypothetical protein